MQIQLIILVAFLSGISCRACEHIKFTVSKKGVPPFPSTYCNNATLLSHCDPSEKYTIATHAWYKGDTAKWAPRLISGFENVTEGCVIWMDYSYYSDRTYPELLLALDEISLVLTRKLRYFEELGFNPENGQMFGFAFGSHIVLNAGIHYGPQKIKRIDCCDPTDKGFLTTAPSIKDAALAAQNVQCIHTSIDFGTVQRFCPKAVNMGGCGIYQPEGLFSAAGSNQLCAEYYIAAFNNDFNLVPKDAIPVKYPGNICFPKLATPDVTQYVPPPKMGYWMDFDVLTEDGEFYCIPNVTAEA